MRDLFRFLHRQRNNLLFLALMGIALSMLMSGSMHHRAQAISSSNAIIGRIYQWRHSVTEFTGLRDENRRLAEALRMRRDSLYGTAADSAVVRHDSVGHQQFLFRTAQVINSTTHKEKNYLTLDRGSVDGIARDMGVIGPQGIVGVVSETSPHFALVISVLNNELAHSVQIRRTGSKGLLKWDTGDPATSSLIDVPKHVLVNVGDTVVTRGGDGVFPPGVPVGTVATVTNDPSSNFHSITVHLSEDLTRTGYVHVVDDRMRAERDTLQAKAAQP